MDEYFWLNSDVEMNISKGLKCTEVHVFRNFQVPNTFSVCTNTTYTFFFLLKVATLIIFNPLNLINIFSIVYTNISLFLKLI